jgi:hypothetical protein
MTDTAAKYDNATLNEDQEQEAFEQWMLTMYPQSSIHRIPGGGYDWATTDFFWKGWQARAKLEQPA